jgi:exonuclease III
MHAEVVPGRFCIVTCSFHSFSLSLAGIYAVPYPTRRMQFWSHHFSNLTTSDFSSENIVFAGDFNTVVDSSLDRENPSHPIFQSEASLLSEVFSTLSLEDSFRVLHPCSKEFTFVNRSSKFGSRIDHIYISSSL